MTRAGPLIYRFILMFSILACRPTPSLCLLSLFFSLCRWFLLCGVRSQLCKAFTCCMLGNVSTQMCLSIKECLLPYFCSFHTVLLRKRRTISLLSFVFSLQSGLGLFLVTFLHDTWIYVVCLSVQMKEAFSTGILHSDT